VLLPFPVLLLLLLRGRRVGRRLWLAWLAWRKLGRAVGFIIPPLCAAKRLKKASVTRCPRPWTIAGECLPMANGD
jgi:hypothetical protein